MVFRDSEESAPSLVSQVLTVPGGGIGSRSPHGQSSSDLVDDICRNVVRTTVAINTKLLQYATHARGKLPFALLVWDFALDFAAVPSLHSTFTLPFLL